MNQGLFLVANIGCTALDEDLGWLCDDETPYEATDPLDFLQGDEIAAVYELYESLYRDIDQKLNIQMPEALLEFNRWIIFRDDTEAVVAFACFKTTEAGLKLGVAATNGQESGKSALKTLLRRALIVEGVYAEVSGGVERVVSGHVPEVHPSAVSLVLGKAVTAEEDDRHYSREITNVGVKRKLLVGRPLADEPNDL